LGIAGFVLLLVVIILYRKFSKNNSGKTSETDFSKTIITNVPSQRYNLEFISGNEKGFSKTIITNVPSQRYNLEFISGNEKGVVPLNKEGEWSIGYQRNTQK